MNAQTSSILPENLLTKVQQISNEISKEHIPVLWQEILKGFSEIPNFGQKNLKYFDGTFGRGGHYRYLKSICDGQMTALVMDQDQQAVQFALENFNVDIQTKKMEVQSGNFSDFSEEKFGTFDMMLLDLGVSSPQLDQAARGFSFYQDGPLDMRMNQQDSVTAEWLINTATENQLIEIFQNYGEVRKPFRVVRAICHDRKEKAFTTTRQLAGLIERVDGWRSKGHHPATQYFMALRLKVNDELEVLAQTLPKLMQALNDKGRLAVISFHSLEDRIVKNLFRSSEEIGFPVNKKVIIASDSESDLNPRSRSAKLRIFQKGVQDELRKYQRPTGF